MTTTHSRGLHRAASLAALGLLAAALPTTAQAASDPLAVTTGVALGVSTVGYASLGVAGGALAGGNFGTAAGAAAVGSVPLLVGPPVAGFSSAARARRRGVSPILAHVGLGCMALGGGATVAAIVSNDVRFEIGALVSSGVLWAGGTGLVVAQGVRNQRAPAPTASAPQRVVVAPWWSGRQVGVGLAMRL